MKLSLVLVVFTVFGSVGCGSPDSLKGKSQIQSLPLRVDNSQPAPRLMTSENDVEFLVYDMSGPAFCQGGLKIVGSADLNGDDWLDYLIMETDSCGNAMPATSVFWVVTPKPGGAVVVSNHAFEEPFASASAEIVGSVVKVQIQDLNNKKSSLEYRFTQQGKLEKLTEVVHATQNAVAVAEIEVTAASWKGSIDDLVISYDINDDGRMDRLKCGLGRSISCGVEMASGEFHKTHLLCRRWGILSSTTEGFHDLVCNDAKVLRWNGQGWK